MTRSNLNPDLYIAWFKSFPTLGACRAVHYASHAIPAHTRCS